MYQPKIDIAEAAPFVEPIAGIEPGNAPAGGSARFVSVLIVLGLPLILLGLLARFLWKDIKAVGSAIAAFRRDAAEELSRS